MTGLAASRRGPPSRVDETPPVRRVLGAAGQPPLLPGRAGPGLQPVHDGDNAQAPALLAEPGSPARTAVPAAGAAPAAAGLGRRPRQDGRPGREAGEQLRPASPPAAGRRPWTDRHHAARQVACGPGHSESLPNSTSRLSARYPAASPAAVPLAALPRVEGEHRLDDVAEQRVQVPLGRRQVGMAHHPLHVGERHAGSRAIR